MLRLLEPIPGNSKYYSEPTDLHLKTLLPGPHDMLGVAFPHLDDTGALFPCLGALQPFRHCSLIDTR